MMNFILLGDSHLDRLNRSESKPGMIGKLFPKSNIIDLSSSGANSKDGLDSVTSNNIPGGSICLVMYGTNDCASWKEVPLDKFKANIKAIIKHSKENNCRIILITQPPVNEQKQTPPGRDNSVVEKYVDVIKALAKEQNTELIDLYDVIKNSMKSTDLHEPDGVHLNKAGYKIFTHQLSLINIQPF